MAKKFEKSSDFGNLLRVSFQELKLSQRSLVVKEKKQKKTELLQHHENFCFSLYF